MFTFPTFDAHILRSDPRLDNDAEPEPYYIHSQVDLQTWVDERVPDEVSGRGFI
jgi:hypothetical protein